jgi:hypothetical protein
MTLPILPDSRQRRSPPKNRKIRTLVLCLGLIASSFGQSQILGDRKAARSTPLDMKIAEFVLKDAILRDGISELTLKNIEGLHLGLEEVIQEKIQDDPRRLNPHFSLRLEDRSVREIIDTLCKLDGRYTWSEDGDSINVYPNATERDPSYLLNLRIAQITVQDIPDPDQALTPLSKLFPTQQVGYFGPGLADNTYTEPWTAVFQDLTVRQFVNRIAEHMGPRTAWTWAGGNEERMFTFLKGGFRTPWAAR